MTIETAREIDPRLEQRLAAQFPDETPEERRDRALAIMDAVDNLNRLLPLAQHRQQ
ncbi:hypothetical protein VB780_25905 [Leptolyngbya sp. CCNP1308]|uniref:hypothetical protein n=1 Tax=Leptolyngbya sp. CCNP1308 TaxID=3110255 RepID=UPI002B2173AE|nr:hypothetical protein [Leptolyngbya sp. CCNP1308]MEA5452035.1 hypothetical protein [Leptolyngbya sp. CCNP1308]